MSHLGEFCAIATALCWTGSSTAFAIASRAVGPLPANQFRLWAAVPVLVLLVWLATGRPWPSHLADERVLLLAASGLAGLVLGDIGYFHALATIGPRLSSVVMATWPGMAAAMAIATGAWPDGRLQGGMALTMAGVLLVLLRSREGAAWNPGVTARARVLGLLGALLGAAGQALGVVLARAAMAAGPDLPDGVDGLSATLVRMVAALCGLQLVACLQRQPLALRAVLRDRHALAAALVGAGFGPVLGVWLSMLATHHAADVGVAAALMATTPIFMMPVAAKVYGARIGTAGVVGTCLAVAGVAVLLVRPAA
jgi:drug/metabolite transporter (DMT)-like permease